MSTWAILIVLGFLFSVLLLLAITVSGWMKRRQMPYAARAVVVILAGLLVPVAAFLGLGFFWVHTSYQGVVPAEERAAIEIIDNVHHTVTSSGNLPQLPSEAFHGELAWQHVPDVIVQQTHGTANSAVWLGGVVLLVPVLILVCIAIGIGLHIWMKQRGKSFSVGAVIVACASLLWLLPVIAVLAFVVWKVDTRSNAVHVEQGKQQVEMAKQFAEIAGRRGLAAAEEWRQHAQSQARPFSPHVPHVTVSEPQPLGVERVVQIPPGKPIVSPNVTELHPLGTEPVPQTPPVTAEKPSEAQPQAPPVAEAPVSDKQPNAPSPVPDWVTRGSVRDGDRTLAVVSSQQFSNEEQARALAMQQAAVLTSVAFHSRYPQARGWKVPESAVNGAAVQKSFVEAIDRKVSTSGTPFRMYRVHLQVESSERVNQTIFPMWNQQVVRQRLSTLMAVGVLLTLIFATTSAYLRLNDWTKGAYRGRLRLAAVSLIVAVGLLTAFLA